MSKQTVNAQLVRSLFRQGNGDTDIVKFLKIRYSTLYVLKKEAGLNADDLKAYMRARADLAERKRKVLQERINL